MTQIEKEIAIKKLTKRLQMLVRELELASLDIASYSIPLSKGEFPNSWVKETNKVFNQYAIEMQRIATTYTELFKEQVEAEDEVVVPIKRRKKK